MSSPDYSQAVKDIIDGLGDSPTPDQIYHAVRSYSIDHVVAAAAAAAKGGGGGGGSQAVKCVRFPFAFDTPGLLTGVTVYTPTPGEALLGSSYVSFTTAWDGFAPKFTLTPADQLSPAVIFDRVDAAVTNNDLPTSSPHVKSPIQIVGANLGVDVLLLLDAEPLVTFVDDGFGGNPGATQGAAEIVLLILAAA